MQITLDIDDPLFAKASRLAGTRDPSALIRECLKALIERESAKRLAKLGGSQPRLRAVRRRQNDPS